jgi:hypothetical protein
MKQTKWPWMHEGLPLLPWIAIIERYICPEVNAAIDFTALERIIKKGLNDKLREAIQKAVCKFCTQDFIITKKQLETIKREHGEMLFAIDITIEALEQLAEAIEKARLPEKILGWKADRMAGVAVEVYGIDLPRWKKLLEAARYTFVYWSARFLHISAAPKNRPSYQGFRELIHELQELYRRAGGKRSLTTYSAGESHDLGGEQVDFILAVVGMIAQLLPQERLKMMPQEDRRQDFIGETIKEQRSIMRKKAI